jgi:myo-inositol-1-phosphate synthase
MFATRHLHVDSWVGHNLLGNRDGAVLADAEHKKAKVQSKEQLLTSLLGETPQSHVSIESIDSLGDWKTAWDHVHFRGFLGVPMTLQFTWQGCDSALAAPLVIDLVRLMDLALRRGEKGAIGALAAFFKSPLGAQPRAFLEETNTLIEWAQR